MTHLFDGKAFAIMDLKGAAKTKTIKRIEENGGSVHKSIQKDTDYLVMKERSVRDLVVIPEKYITDCIEKKSL